ncbi:MAG: GNAT family N-acetyltransferase [Steroidobacteraceae bacterium]|jgi:ribosomal-protein-alanine N-acetyltransferase
MSELSTLGLAEPADAREIAEMSRDLIEHGLTWSWTPARVQHFITGSDSSVVVARCDRGGAQPMDARRGDARRTAAPRIAAFAIMHFGDEVAHLNLLAVAPEHRRQGLGRQLMDWLTGTAIVAGVFRINLELRTHNGDARAFYERLGFDELGVVQGYYQGREAALRMSRRLGTAPG